MKLKLLFLGLLMACGVLAIHVQSVMAVDTNVCDDKTISADLKEIAGCNEDNTVDNVANEVIKIVIGVIGLVAVGVMFYGGFNFIISRGDAARVQKSKYIIMYGLIGLIVSIMAYAIVLFVGKVIGG